MIRYTTVIIRDDMKIGVDKSFLLRQGGDSAYTYETILIHL